MTYSKEQYDTDLEKLQQAFANTRVNTKWSHNDVYAYTDILRLRLDNFKSYTEPKSTD